MFGSFVRAGILAVFFGGVNLFFSPGVLADEHWGSADAEQHCEETSQAAADFKNAQYGAQYGCGNPHPYGGACPDTCVHTDLTGTYDGKWTCSVTLPGSIYSSCSGIDAQFVTTHNYFFIDCLSEEPYYDFFSTNEPGSICNNHCEFEPTTGSCISTVDGGYSCYLAVEPTGNTCTDDPNDEPLPDDCIRNETTGKVACDCEVDPTQHFCLPPDIDDHDLPPNCVRNEFNGNIECYEDGHPDSPDPDNPDINDPQQPDDTPIPGDDDGDGVCEVGEACAGDNVSNELLGDILDQLRGTGMEAPSPKGYEGERDRDFASLLPKAEGQLGSAFSDQKGTLDGHEAGAVSDVGTRVSNAFTTGTSCPTISIDLGGNAVFAPDMSQIIGPIRGISSFIMWMTVFYLVWVIWFRWVFK